MNILPGEPLPPGSEDEVTQITEIQKAIDQYKGNALIGLEYTIELHEDNREVNYLCVICDKRSDSRTVMQHWTSYNHRLKYLEKHYPTAVRELNKIKHKPDGPSIMVNVVQSLAEAIEDHHGRLNPTAFSADDFRRTKSKTINGIYTKFHYDEKTGPNFVSIVDRTLWESQPASSSVVPKPSLQITIKSYSKRSVEPVSRDGLDEVSSDSDTDGPRKTKKREQSPAYRFTPRQQGTVDSESTNKPVTKILPTPKELSMQASLIAQERYKWEKFRCMLEIQLKQMRDLQSEYERNPEKHPLYPEEWKKFWNRRYKELQIENKVDPNKYDYKPEWIAFWNVRVKELFQIEVEKKKKEIKATLNLPEDAEERVDQLKEKYKLQVNRNSSKPPELPPGRHSNSRDSHKGDVIDISDEDSPVRRPKHRSRSRSFSNTRRRSSRSISPRGNLDYKRSRHRDNSPSLSPFSDDFERGFNGPHRKSRHAAPPAPGGPYYDPPPYMRHRYAAQSPPPPRYMMPTGYRPKDPYLAHPRYEPHSVSSGAGPSQLSKNLKSEDTPEPEDEGPLTVVAVLRLLTALEDQLGSLGPKVVDLLGKALALEKIKANSADDLLMNEDNCVFFETTKEKLKGLLIAEVIEDPQKIRAVKKAIKNIAATMHQVSVKSVEKEKKAAEDAIEITTTPSLSAGPSKKPKAKTRLPSAATDLPFDRQVIVSKLAAALVKEGRDDVSVDDMDKLIYFFILLVKLNKQKIELDGVPLQMRDAARGLGIPALTKVIAPSTSVLAPVAKPILPSALPAIVDELLESGIGSFVNRALIADTNDTSNDVVVVPERETSKNNDANGGSLESLTDSDLQTLLQNFRHLSSEEQEHLIRHLKKLEHAEPARYVKLRKFINMADLDEASVKLLSEGDRADSNAPSTSTYRPNRFGGEDSPLAKRDRRGDNDKEHSLLSGVNVSNPNKFTLDDEDDDDYNFDDVLKAATSNVDSNSRQSRSTRNASVTPERTATSNRPSMVFSKTDTENLIENIMGSLNQKNRTSSTSSTNAVSQPQPEPAPSAGPPHRSMPGPGGPPLQPPAGGPMPPFPQQQDPQQAYSQQQGYQQQPYHQQGFGANNGPGYNQMNPWDPSASAFYNSNAMNGMPNYNNGPNYAGYPNQSQWNNNAAQMQQYGNYMHPQQQQQMGYNMYGGS